jgi:hypothetical protein
MRGTTAPADRKHSAGSRAYRKPTVVARFPSKSPTGVLKDDVSPTIGCGQLALPGPGVILDSVVHCPGHECAHGIRSFCSYRDGYFLRIRTASHIFHSRIRVLMCAWLCLRLSARCVAFRCGRTDMVGNRCEKVVGQSKTENPNLTADEIPSRHSTLSTRQAQPSPFLDTFSVHRPCCKQVR